MPNRCPNASDLTPSFGRGRAVGWVRLGAALALASALAACQSSGGKDSGLFGSLFGSGKDAKKVSAVESAPAASRPAEADSKPTREMVRSVQRMLAELGYRPGQADGLYGPKTAKAIQHFQAKQGLRPDGRVTKPLIAALTKQVRGKPGFGEGPKLNGAKMPTYEVGDRFVYSDGLVETATDVKGNKVLWETNQNAIYTAYRNFILPPVFREADGRSERTSVDVAATALWPLRVGAEVAFKSVTEVTEAGGAEDSGRAEERWTCRVEGTESVSVAAGDFNAFRVACRNKGAAGGISGERLWYYAPSIGHYVKRVEVTGGPPREVELVAIRLAGFGWPPAARAGLGWAFQHALETKSPGEAVEWSSSGVDTNVTIKPTTKLSTEEASYCRTFKQMVKRPSGQRIYPGKACRDATGRWTIPGLEDASPGANPKS